ncbi:MAG: hypothetical protein D6683_04320 [Actinomyces sp.]|nr:MAG: hypothetical protein D6683_04320 [Actinomyces sp.]
MTALALAAAAAAVVVVVAGGIKIADPSAASDLVADLMGRSARPVGPDPGAPRVVRRVVRLVGVVEVTLGLVALGVDRAGPAAALALAYLVFAAVVLVARRRGLGGCGCLGARSGPPSLAHAAVDLAAALAAGAAALVGPSPARALADTGGPGAVVVGLVAGVMVTVLAGGGGPSVAHRA